MRAKDRTAAAIQIEGGFLMGRPAMTLTEDQRREVETLAALLSQEQIADYFGIARNTFRAICDREEDVYARYKRGKAKAIAHVANGLLQKARNGDTASMIFYLKTQAGWRETAEIAHVVAASDGGAGQTARAKLRARLDEIASRQLAAGAIDAVANPPNDAVAQVNPRLENVRHAGKGSLR